MKKAYGIRVGECFDGNVMGACVTEDGALLGNWVSSDESFLSEDLKKHAGGFDYEYIGRCPTWLNDRILKYTRPLDSSR